MTLSVPEFASSASALSAARHIAPSAFDGSTSLNLIAGQWVKGASEHTLISPNDGSEIGSLSMVDASSARSAVDYACEAHAIWSASPLGERKTKVADAVATLKASRNEIALLLSWEIGKPWRLALADIDRATEGVEWYLEEIDGMLLRDSDGNPVGRRALPGPVSNIASWNYPMSVLVHSELVQLLSGNAVVAKTPTQGGGLALALAHSIMKEAGLPVTLLAGLGHELSDALVRHPGLGAVAFVGGRSNGARVEAGLAGSSTRYMLEQEGLNAWGVWDYSDWDALKKQLRKGYEYGKQRCTAYPRFVVQRDLVDQFLSTYLEVMKSLRVGHPLAIEEGMPDTWDSLPDLEFGPLISVQKADELRERSRKAIRQGAVPLYRGELDPDRFILGQDQRAYVAPMALLEPSGVSSLRRSEPFGPVDSIVVVDTKDQMVAEMNASNGALVATVSSDKRDEAQEIAMQLNSFKVGVNQPRSRGDRAEPFGGGGASWKGAFVGGEHLVHAVTYGHSKERLYGNFPEYTRRPLP